MRLHLIVTSGSEGKLGVSLSRKVIISDVTIDHVGPSVALDLSSAPKDFEVVGIVENKTDIERLKIYREEEAERNKAALGSASDPNLDSEAAMSTNLKDNEILVAVGSYDTSADRYIQTFSIHPSYGYLQIPVSSVILKIHSNHGNEDFTCLYRFRVHGDEPGEASLKKN
jgi:SUN domain-containing protein 1/2